MNRNKIKSLIEIARTHESHLLYAINNLADIFPITEEKVAHLTQQEVLVVDFFVNRFCRLQDFMGSSLVDAVLIQINEFANDLTMIDKMNKLEKFHLIKDAHLWLEIRKLRNNLTHEYPNHPELIVKFLNQAYSLSSELLEVLNNLLSRLESSSS